MGLFCGGAGLIPSFQPQWEVIRSFLCFSRVLAAFDPLDLTSWEAGVPGWPGSESTAPEGEGAWEELLGRKFQKQVEAERKRGELSHRARTWKAQRRKLGFPPTEGRAGAVSTLHAGVAGLCEFCWFSFPPGSSHRVSGCHRNRLMGWGWVGREGLCSSASDCLWVHRGCPAGFLGSVPYSPHCSQIHPASQTPSWRNRGRAGAFAVWRVSCWSG